MFVVKVFCLNLIWADIQNLVRCCVMFQVGDRCENTNDKPYRRGSCYSSLQYQVSLRPARSKLKQTKCSKETRILGKWILTPNWPLPLHKWFSVEQEVPLSIWTLGGIIQVSNAVSFINFVSHRVWLYIFIYYIYRYDTFIERSCEQLNIARRQQMNVEITAKIKRLISCDGHYPSTTRRTTFNFIDWTYHFS